MILFDMDGTLVSYPVLFGGSWNMLGLVAGVEGQQKINLERYMRQRKNYEEWVKEDVSLFIGKEAKPLLDKIFPPLYSPGVRDFFGAIKGEYITGIISGGLNLVADYIAKDLSIDFCVANDVGISNGVFDGSFRVNVDLWNEPTKAYWVKFFREKHGIKKEKTMFVGDHEPDLITLPEVGFFVAFNPKEEVVKKSAHATIYNFNELISILKK